MNKIIEIKDDELFALKWLLTKGMEQTKSNKKFEIFERLLDNLSSDRKCFLSDVSRSFPCQSLDNVRQNVSAILATTAPLKDMTDEQIQEIDEIALEILECCRENCYNDEAMKWLRHEANL